MTKNKKEEKKETYKSGVGIVKFIKDVFSWTVFIILLIIAILLVYYVFANYRYSKKGKGYEPLFSLYTIISPSMEPKIKVYDVIVDVPVKDASKLKVNDIITFKSDSSVSKGMTVTHRIADIKQVDGKYYFTTKGDNNQTVDSALASEDNVMGIVKFRIPQLGRVQYFLASRGGWLIVILIPAIIILITDAIKLTRMLLINKKMDEIADKPEEKDPKIEEDRKKILKEKLDKKDLDDIELELPKLKK